VSASESSAPRNLQEVLRRAAEHGAERRIEVFDRRGRTSEGRTHAQLLEAARLFAARFARRGVAPRDRVLVCLHTSWPALEAWFGALFRGAWPVMLVPGGGLGALEAQVPRVEGVCELLDARCLVCESSFRDELARQGARRAAAVSVTPEELAASSVAAALPDPQAEPEEMAFMQLTSGSTGRPRAVMISHRGAVHNPIAIGEAVSAARQAGPVSDWARAVACWVPLYHDMGLVGCLLFSIAHRLDLWLMRPETFLTRPRLWLELLGRGGPNLAPAPNFAYQFCVERVAPAELTGADLGRWAAAMCGAEMIRPETVRAFCGAFAQAGFDPRSLRPCYGLAEGTLAVTFDRQGGARMRTAPQGADAGFGLSEVVSTGPPLAGMEIRITAPDGTILPEGVIGEVQMRGPSVCLGYFNDEPANAEAFQGGWFRTGDLGFVEAGELYLTGRLKDLLIIHGQNLMPHEVEWIAEAVRGSGGTERAAAFSVARGPGGEEAVLVMEVLQETPEQLRRLGHEIRVRLGHELKLPLADLVFVQRGRLPKTTSGKVQRGELRRRYLEGRMERLM
jgi:acyl-CoA synthetase (AMP-forming)/AMP-acid ligase II